MLFNEVVFFNKLIEDSCQVGFSDFLQVVTNLYTRFVDFDNPVKIDRCSNNNTIAWSIFDGFLEVVCLFFAVSHSRKQGCLC